MKKLKVIVEFDGHKYNGWQIQSDGVPTVQAFFNRALSRIYKQEVKSIASGRTDAGVHSLDHHVVFKSPFQIPLDSLVRAINANLPADIRALSCTEVAENFRPTNDALSREYRYFFSNLETQRPFTRNYMANISYTLDVEKMRQACLCFVGEHDFNSFHCVGSDPSTTIRYITKCELISEESCFNGIIPQHYSIRITGNGFLKQMVRLIVGSIWAVGSGRLEIEAIERELESGSGKHICPVAPASGLFKFSVEYSN